MICCVHLLQLYACILSITSSSINLQLPHDASNCLHSRRHSQLAETTLRNKLHQTLIQTLPRPTASSGAGTFTAICCAQLQEWGPALPFTAICHRQRHKWGTTDTSATADRCDQESRSFCVERLNSTHSFHSFSCDAARAAESIPVLENNHRKTSFLHCSSGSELASSACTLFPCVFLIFLFSHCFSGSEWRMQ